MVILLRKRVHDIWISVQILQFAHNFIVAFLFFLKSLVKNVAHIFEKICDFKVTNWIKVSKSQIFVHEYSKIDYIFSNFKIN